MLEIENGEAGMNHSTRTCPKNAGFVLFYKMSHGALTFVMLFFFWSANTVEGRINTVGM